MSIIAPSPTSVYRYYDTNRILIYVGITSRGIKRNREHNATKEWWPLVASQEVDHFDTREEAERRELELIAAHIPPFNTHHNREHALSRQAYMEFLASQADYRPLREAIAALPGKRLDLEPHDGPQRNMILRTRAADAQIARAIRIDEPVRAYGLRKPTTVAKVEHVGPFALLWLSRDARPLIDAHAVIKSDHKYPDVARLRVVQVRLNREAAA